MDTNIKITIVTVVFALAMIATYASVAIIFS